MGHSTHPTAPTRGRGGSHIRDEGGNGSCCKEGMGGTGALQAYLLPLTPTSMPPPPDTMGRHTDTTRQSLMGAAGATNLTPQHTARSPLPKTAHGGREEGDTGISISIVSPPPPTQTPRNTEAQQKHTARSRLCSCRGGGILGRAGAQGWGGWSGVGGEGTACGAGTLQDAMAPGC